MVLCSPVRVLVLLYTHPLGRRQNRRRFSVLFFRAMQKNHLGSVTATPHRRKKSAHTVVLRDNSSGPSPRTRPHGSTKGSGRLFVPGSRHYSEQETAPTPSVSRDLSPASHRATGLVLCQRRIKGPLVYLNPAGFQPGRAVGQVPGKVFLTEPTGALIEGQNIIIASSATHTFVDLHLLGSWMTSEMMPGCCYFPCVHVAAVELP